jgi:hypothetical protein
MSVGASASPRTTELHHAGSLSLPQPQRRTLCDRRRRTTCVWFFTPWSTSSCSTAPFRRPVVREAAFTALPLRSAALHPSRGLNPKSTRAGAVIAVSAAAGRPSQGRVRNPPAGSPPASTRALRRGSPQPAATHAPLRGQARGQSAPRPRRRTHSADRTAIEGAAPPPVARAPRLCRVAQQPPLTAMQAPTLAPPVASADRVRSRACLFDMAPFPLHAAVHAGEPVRRWIAPAAHTYHSIPDARKAQR